MATVTTALSEAIDEAARVLRGQGAREVYLFGSAATGRLHSRSDVDLAVGGLRPERFLRALALVTDVLDRPVSLADLDEDTPFARYLKSRGN